MYTYLKSTIVDKIKQNGNREITGQLLQDSLISIINVVGKNATFAGVASLSTVPGTPAGPIFYITSDTGVFPNFGGVETNGISVITNQSGAWVATRILDTDKINSKMFNELGYFKEDAEVVRVKTGSTTPNESGTRLRVLKQIKDIPCVVKVSSRKGSGALTALYDTRDRAINAGGDTKIPLDSYSKGIKDYTISEQGWLVVSLKKDDDSAFTDTEQNEYIDDLLLYIYTPESLKGRVDLLNNDVKENTADLDAVNKETDKINSKMFNELGYFKEDAEVVRVNTGSTTPNESGTRLRVLKQIKDIPCVVKVSSRKGSGATTGLYDTRDRAINSGYDNKIPSNPYSKDIKDYTISEQGWLVVSLKKDDDSAFTDTEQNEYIDDLLLYVYTPESLKGRVDLLNNDVKENTADLDVLTKHIKPIRNLTVNGGFANGTNDWIKGNGAASAELIDDVVKVTGNENDFTVSFYQNIDEKDYINIGDVFYFKIRVRSTSDKCTRLRAYLGTSGSISQGEIAYITNPVKNKWYDLTFYGGTEFENSRLGVNFVYPNTGTKASGETYEIDKNVGVTLINITDVFGAGNEPSKEIFENSMPEKHQETYIYIPSKKPTPIETVDNIISRNKEKEGILPVVSGYPRPLDRNDKYGIKKDLSFGLITDMHIDHSDKRVDVAKNFISYINHHNVYIDFGMNLGDTCRYYPDESIDNWVNASESSEIPVLPVVGNHDRMVHAKEISIEGMFNKHIQPFVAKGFIDATDCYYYKDFDSYGVRLIVLNPYDVPSKDEVVVDWVSSRDFYYPGHVFYQQAQIDWLIDLLYNTPADYHVIIAHHQYQGVMVVDDHPFSNLFFKNNGGELDLNNENLMRGGSPIPDIVDAFQNSTNLSKTYDFSQNIADKVGYSNVVAEKDFSLRSDNGIFVSYFAGHTHRAMVGYPKGYPNQKIVVLSTGSFQAGQSLFENDMFPSLGNVSEDNFYIVGVDKDLRLLKLMKVGGTKTIHGTTRDFTAISY